ncbi:hypothetical protein G9C98_008162 [Cotesia typhae]|uniref:Uncharacterized protein n=1 Tax=Cotesia typhae TaxID=2053667 RepID=A0A8J5RGS9_9HYME|nr:hypothetical protein G9C98_008162 [Cotesia typhae]
MLNANMFIISLAAELLQRAAATDSHINRDLRGDFYQGRLKPNEEPPKVPPGLTDRDQRLHRIHWNPQL